MENKIIKQHYKITTSVLNFNLLEQKIICTILAELRNIKETEQNIIINFDYNNLSTRHIELDNALKNIISKPIIFIEKDKTKIIANIISYAKIKNCKIKVEINNALKPYLINLSKNYTYYELREILTFKSKYALKWYMLACHWQDVGQFTETLENIREIFNVKNEYLDKRGLIQKVVKNPLAELKKTKNIYLEIDKTNRNGRFIESITFNVVGTNTAVEKINEFKTTSKTDKNTEQIEGVSNKKIDKNEQNLIKMNKILQSYFCDYTVDFKTYHGIHYQFICSFSDMLEKKNNIFISQYGEQEFKRFHGWIKTEMENRNIKSQKD